MHNNSWIWGTGSGIGWGTYFVVIGIFIVLVFALRSRRKK